MLELKYVENISVELHFKGRLSSGLEGASAIK